MDDITPKNDSINTTGDDFLRRHEPRWNKSKEQAWDELQARLDAAPARTESLPARRIWPRWAAAASLALLLGTALFARLHTRTIGAAAGERLSALLPDGSRITLNSESAASFHPYWWWRARAVELSGEAFFEVEPGADFAVLSEQGATRVLGTSFNVFARGQAYQVTCLTGKVGVSVAGDRHELRPGMTLRHHEGQPTELLQLDDPGQAALWRDDVLAFADRPLREVLDELERQYGSRLVLPEGLDLRYTGQFGKPAELEMALALVCRPFGLEFARAEDGSYTLSRP